MIVILLQPDDDIVSVRDRLDWIDEQQVLLVLDEGIRAKLFTDSMALIHLRRYSERQRLEIGLVVSDKELARKARALGVAAFNSVEEGLTSRRGWWRARRPNEQLGLPYSAIQQASVDPAADSKVEDAIRPRIISSRHWMFRYAAIILFCCATALIAIGFAYSVPRAMVTLMPEMTPLSTTLQVTGDPHVASVNFQNDTIPARLLFVDLTWQSEIETTGSRSVPVGRARGQVVFLNNTEQAIEVPAGTVLSTADEGHLFQTVTSVTTNAVLSSTVAVDVAAIEAGPQNNVDAGTITQIDGELSQFLLVTNPAETAGGAVQAVAVVTEEDVERLRSQVLQFLQAVAMAELEAALTEREVLARESLHVVELRRETYSHQAGEEADSLGLKMEARIRGTVVDLSLATGLAYEALTAHTPKSFNLVSGSIRFQRTDVLEANKNGLVTFLIVADGLMAADLDLDAPLQAISGQRPELAVAYMNEELPLRQVPVVEVWPKWFKRVPYLTSRIQTSILTEG